VRVPSRRMPRAARLKSGWFGTTLALGLVALLLLGLVAVWWPLAILVAAAVFGISLIGWLRDRRVAEARKGESICQFARGFDRRTIDTWIIRAVYEEFSGAFPLRPSDRLREDLHIDDDDLDFGAISIALRTGRSLDGYERNPMYGNIKTLRDMAMFFHYQPLLSAARVRQQR
jgi:hypothetical protein